MHSVSSYPFFIYRKEYFYLILLLGILLLNFKSFQNVLRSEKIPEHFERFLDQSKEKVFNSFYIVPTGSKHYEYILRNTYQ